MTGNLTIVPYRADRMGRAGPQAAGGGLRRHEPAQSAVGPARRDSSVSATPTGTAPRSRRPTSRSSSSSRSIRASSATRRWNWPTATGRIWCFTTWPRIGKPGAPAKPMPGPRGSSLLCYYRTVRIHNGVLPDGVMGNRSIVVERTKYWDYGSAKVWHAVRELTDYGFIRPRSLGLALATSPDGYASVDGRVLDGITSSRILEAPFALGPRPNSPATMDGGVTKAAVWLEPNSTSRVEDIEVMDPGAGRGAGGGGGRRGLPLRPPSWLSAISARTGFQLFSATKGQGWWKRSATESRRSAPGDRVSFCFIPSVRPLPPVPARPPQSLRARIDRRPSPGPCSTALRACGDRTAPRCSSF